MSFDSKFHSIMNKLLETHKQTQNIPPLEKHQVDFKQALYFAELASDAYQPLASIQEKYSHSLMKIGNVAESDVQYFVLNNEKSNTIEIVIRGTANLKNGVEDLEYAKEFSNELNCYLHKGFLKSAQMIYQQITSELEEAMKEKLDISITGHSLGGAIAAILAMYLKQSQLPLKLVYTFGQPKVTDNDGVSLYANLPLTRFVDEKDIVPLVPMVTPLSSIHGIYRHFGAEVLLLKDKYFAYLNEHFAEKYNVSSFWENIGHEKIDDHFMVNYLKRIKDKITDTIQVSFERRENFE